MNVEEITKKITEMKPGDTVTIGNNRVYKTVRGFRVTDDDHTTYYQREATVIRILDEKLNVKPMKPRTVVVKMKKEKVTKYKLASLMLIIQLVAIGVYFLAVLRPEHAPELQGFVSTILPYTILGVVLLFGVIATLFAKAKGSWIVAITNTVMLLACLGWIGRETSISVSDLISREAMNCVIRHQIAPMAVVITLVLLSNLFKIRKREVKEL